MISEWEIQVHSFIATILAIGLILAGYFLRWFFALLGADSFGGAAGPFAPGRW